MTTNQQNWREELQNEMEDYIMDAEMSPGELKNQYMRQHFEKLIDFISSTIQSEVSKAVKERDLQQFLGSVFGISIYAETTNELKIKQIGDYLERARQALMDKDNTSPTRATIGEE